MDPPLSGAEKGETLQTHRGMAGADNTFRAEQVERAQQGDEQARSELLTALEPILRGYFIKRIGQEAAVDDLVQNTLLRIHEGLADLEKPGSLKAFAMKAAMFELQDYYRGRYDMKEQLYDPELERERSDAAGESLAHVDVDRALDMLPDKTRRILELREYGFKYREIAQMVDLTEAAIKMRVKRAFEKLRDALAAICALLLPLGL